MEAARTAERLKQLGDVLAGPANAVKKVASIAWKVLTLSPGEAVVPASCLCAEISKGRVDIVHAARKFSKLRIKAEKTYRYAEDTLPSPEEVASAIAVSFKDFGIGKTDVVLVVPKEWVVVKSAALPAAAAENLGQVVTYELDRFTPFSSDEAYYDFLVGGKTADSIEIFVAAAKAGTITDYTDKLLERGVSVTRVSFDLSSLATACRFATGEDSFVFAGIDHNGIKGGVVEAGILKTAASRDFRGDDPVLNAAVVESFLSDQQSFPTTAPAISAPIVAFLDEMNFLAETLGSRAVAKFDVLNGMDKKLARPTGNGTARASLSGGAIEYLWTAAHGFNLLSRGIRQQARKPFLLSIILAVIIAACLIASFFVPISTEEERLREIDRQINMRKEEVRNVEKLKDQIEALNKRMTLINNFKHSTPLYLDLTKELTLIIPKNAWFTRVRIAGAQVSIEGYAPSATALIQILESSKYFQKAEFSSPTFRDARMNMDRFQIKMDIRGVKTEGAENEKK